MSNPGAASANNTSAASTGFASVLQPLEFNAPLLVVFNKVQYPAYVEHCLLRTSAAAASSSSNGVSSPLRPSSGGYKEQHSRIFQSQSSFLRWEGAVELHAACLDKVGMRIVQICKLRN